MRTLVLDPRPRLISSSALGPLRTHVQLMAKANPIRHGGSLGIVVNRWVNEWVSTTDVHLHLVTLTLTVSVRRALLPWLR